MHGAENQDADSGIKLHLDPGLDGQGGSGHHRQVGTNNVGSSRPRYQPVTNAAWLDTALWSPGAKVGSTQEGFQ